MPHTHTHTYMRITQASAFLASAVVSRKPHTHKRTHKQYLRFGSPCWRLSVTLARAHAYTMPVLVVLAGAFVSHMPHTNAEKSRLKKRLANLTTSKGCVERLR